MPSYQWPPQGGSGSGGGVNTYANLAAFPSAITAGNGALAIALDTNILYESNGTSWLAIGAPGSVLGLAAFGSTPNADGASIVSNNLTLQPASATFPGGVTTGAQTLAGVKTFSSAPKLSSLTASEALVLDGSNNIASLTYTNVASASTIVSRDINGNSNFNNIGISTTNTVSNASTPVVMTYGSSGQQTVSGTTTQVFNLPDATYLILGQFFEFTNNSTGIVTVNNWAGSLVQVIPPGGFTKFTCTNNSTQTGVWVASNYLTGASLSGTAGTSVPGTFAAGTTVTGTQLISTIATGTAPLTVTSTTQVANLYASTAPASTLTGTALNSTVVTSSLTSLGIQSQALNMGSFNINALLDPTTAQQAATKNYVDTVASSLQTIQAVVYASASTNYPGTMVGNVLTITATGAISIDGSTPSANQRVLLKDQSTQSQNGVYVVTVVGSGGISPVLTRASDYNTAADVNAGDLIPVILGTVNTTTSWLQTATIVTLNSDSLVFVEWTANPANYLLKANNLSDVTSKTTSFNNITPTTTLGDIIYGGAAGVGTRLAGDTSNTRKFLRELSVTSTATAPVWDTLISGDIPNNAANTSGTAAVATTLTTTTETASATYYPIFAPANSSSNQTISVGPMTYNPNTGVLTSTNFTGAVTGTASGNTTYTANQYGLVVSGSANAMSVIAPVATTTFVLTNTGGATGAPTWAAPAAAANQTAVFNESQTAGTNGGAFTAGSWVKRTLNNTQQSQSWASLSGSQITLTSGTYLINASAPAQYVNSHKARFYNVTTSATAITGTSEYSSTANTGGLVTRSFIQGVVTIAGSTVFEIDHQCSTTNAGSGGFGIAADFDNEIYTTISIQKQ